MTEFYDHTASA